MSEEFAVSAGDGGFERLEGVGGLGREAVMLPLRLEARGCERGLTPLGVEGKV